MLTRLLRIGYLSLLAAGLLAGCDDVPSAEEVSETLVGQTLVASHPKLPEKAYLELAEGGSARFRLGSFADKGLWRPEAGQACVTWELIADGEPQCYGLTLSLFGDSFALPDGTSFDLDFAESFPSAAAQATLPQDGRRQQEGCITEQIVYESDGRSVIGWLQRPVTKGPYPVFVWNHADRLKKGRRAPDFASIGYDDPCHWLVTGEKVAVFYPEGRGYGGGEGWKVTHVAWDAALTRRYLRGRAADVLAGLDKLEWRRYLRRDCLLFAGHGHGGAVAILAAALTPGAPAIAQAPGSGHGTAADLALLQPALERLEAPLLLQHASDDRRVDIAVSRQLAEGSSGRATLKEYQHPKEGDGHGLFTADYAEVWGPDFKTALQPLLDCK